MWVGAWVGGWVGCLVGGFVGQSVGWLLGTEVCLYVCMFALLRMNHHRVLARLPTQRPDNLDGGALLSSSSVHGKSLTFTPGTMPTI